ncbi:MAG: histidine phosphatase family protein [bacterium]
MNNWQIPPSVLRHLDEAPTDRPVVVLLRHSVREDLAPDDVGYDLPITEIGRRLAVELGALLHGRLRTLHTSPLARCVQTAGAIAEGAGADLRIVPSRLLGDPGVFVLDGKLAWKNWQELGHEGVMQHLVTNNTALPGMAQPDQAARFLVQSMLATAADEPGIHIFVTHDLLVTATAASMLGRPLRVDDWPEFLEAAFFWRTDEGVHAAYRDYTSIQEGAFVCELSACDST